MSEFINEWFIHASSPLIIWYYFSTIFFWVAFDIYQGIKSGSMQDFDYTTECTLTTAVLFSPKIGWLLAVIWSN